jgi:hypothetical protein
MAQTTTVATLDISALLAVREMIDRIIDGTTPTGPLSGLTLTNAMLAVVAEAEHPLSAAEVHTALVAGAFHTKSKHLRVEIHGIGNELISKGRLGQERRGGRKFFKALPTT